VRVEPVEHRLAPQLGNELEQDILRAAVVDVHGGVVLEGLRSGRVERRREFDRVQLVEHRSHRAHRIPLVSARFDEDLERQQRFQLANQP
jgi:hypothetical protein